MAAIEDDELILFHYRDGLSAARLKQIERELAASVALRRRYEELRAVLAAVDREPVPEPTFGFEDRLWRRLQARLGGSASIANVSAAGSNVVPLRAGRRDVSPRHDRFRWWGVGWASAAAVLLALGFIFLSGSPRETLAPLQSQALATPHAMAQRVLAMKVTEHLRSTEVVLLSAMNNDSGALDFSYTELAASLVENNRLYSAAMARSGNRALAGFLRTLEPVLLELANSSGDGGIQSREGLRSFLSSTDLLFQVRAVEARLLSGAMSA